jgi:hypothetical protein
MHGAPRQPAGQRPIGPGMTKRRTSECVTASALLKALDLTPQTRKRVHACAGHAPLPAVEAAILPERMTSLFVHDMF